MIRVKDPVCETEYANSRAEETRRMTLLPQGMFRDLVIIQ